MTLKVLVLGALFCATTMVIAMDKKDDMIKMPNYETIFQQISKCTPSQMLPGVTTHFITETNIIKRLFNKSLTPLEVSDIVESSCHNYEKEQKQRLEKSMFDWSIYQMSCSKHTMLKVLLENNKKH